MGKDCQRSVRDEVARRRTRVCENPSRKNTFAEAVPRPATGAAAEMHRSRDVSGARVGVRSRVARAVGSS